jgi:5'-nucleotidase
VNLNVTGSLVKDILEQQFAGAFGQTSTKMLQISGLSYVWNPAAAVGSRIVSIKVGGVPIDPMATYTVTTNNFVAAGGDGFTKFLSGTNQVGGPIDLDVLIAYVKAHTPLTPFIDGRITQGTM